MIRLPVLYFLSLSLFACNLSNSNQTQLKQLDNEEKLKQNRIRKKCGNLNIVYKAFQDYIICLENLPPDTILNTKYYAEFYIVENVSGVRKDDMTIQVACANVFNQGYESIVPEEEKRNTELNMEEVLRFYDMDYFHDLYISLNHTPAEGTFEYIERGDLMGGVFDKDSKTQYCFYEKLKEYHKKIKWFGNTKEDHKTFLKDCRKQEGEKVYKKLNQQFDCDTI